MRGDKTAIEQLQIVRHPGGNAGDAELALLGGEELAVISGSGQIQWLYLDWKRPDAWQACESREMAHAVVKLWVSGLDVVPWDENGQPVGVGLR
jgi:hypothetical protein